MTQEPSAKMRVSPEVARIVSPGASRDLKLAAAQGTLGLAGRELVTALYFLCHGSDPEIRAHAVHTLRALPESDLAAIAADLANPPQLLHLLAQVRLHDAGVIQAILDHPAIGTATHTLLAGRCEGEGLKVFLLAVKRWQSCELTVAALKTNPHLDPVLKARLDGFSPAPAPVAAPAAPPPTVAPVEETEEDSADDAEEEEEEETDADADEPEPEEDVNASKYQMALEMGVSEKIKMALTGDKEWRSIFLKDPNKLVHGAAIKNPRITDGEVLAISKNKASSEELIRAILLNKEWVKLPLIRAALVVHPKTPTPQALRYLPYLGVKELKVLGKSKGVSQVLVNAARTLVASKDKKK